jgi:hypothetical protein
MDSVRYRVDPRMVPPVVMAMVFGILLVILEGFTGRGLLLTALLIPFFYLGLEILARRISIDSRGILISKFLRSVSVNWSEIESLDAVKSGSKLFLILETVRTRPVIITNTIRPFRDLAERLLDRLPPERVTSAAREILQQPPSKHGPMIQAWIVCLVLGAMVVGRFLGYG